MHQRPTAVRTRRRGLASANAIAFIGADIIGGVGMGISNAASMRALLPHAAPEQRAGLLSIVYATSYIGGAVPSLIAGQLSRTLDLFWITIGYEILALLAALLTLAFASDHRGE